MDNTMCCRFDGDIIERMTDYGYWNALGSLQMTRGRHGIKETFMAILVIHLACHGFMVVLSCSLYKNNITSRGFVQMLYIKGVYC